MMLSTRMTLRMMYPFPLLSSFLKSLSIGNIFGVRSWKSGGCEESAFYTWLPAVRYGFFEAVCVWKEFWIERVLERDRKKSNLEMEDLKRSKLGMRATARCLCKHNSVEGKIWLYTRRVLKNNEDNRKDICSTKHSSSLDNQKKKSHPQGCRGSNRAVPDDKRFFLIPKAQTWMLSNGVDIVNHFLDHMESSFMLAQ